MFPTNRGEGITLVVLAAVVGCIDEDTKTLFVTCNKKVYRIRTNVHGALYTLKREK